MGVPKFYRWMSERYPCLSQVVKDYQVKGVVNGSIEVELYVPRYFTTLVCRSSAHNYCAHNYCQGNLCKTKLV